MRKEMACLSLNDLSEIVGGIRYVRYNGNTRYDTSNLNENQCWELLKISVRNGDHACIFYTQNPFDCAAVHNLNDALRHHHMLAVE